MSSYDGSRIYVSNEFLIFDDRKKAQDTIEHEAMHNLSRYMNKVNPNDIYPVVMSMLRINDEIFDAGYYYDYKAKNKKVEDPCPFRLYVPVIKYVK